MNVLGGIEPTRQGEVERAGVSLHWEEYGDQPGTILLMPPWNLTQARAWRLMVGCLLPSFRVVLSDPVGNGASGSSADPARFAPEALAEDALAVMDAVSIPRAVVVAHSRTAQGLLTLAAEHPDRVAGAVFLAPFLPYTRSFFPRFLTHPALRPAFESPFPVPLGWGRLNAHYLATRTRAFGDWFGRLALSSPHSERAAQETADWAAAADPTSLVASLRAPLIRDRDDLDRWAAKVTVPVLVVHGDADRLTPLADGRWLADATGGRLVVLEGGDHCPHGKQVVRTSLETRRFAHEALGVAAPAVAERTDRSRPGGRRRVLVVSSPIGLGHARRDVAIVRALRELRDDVDVEWLAQSPVTTVLAAAGEVVHPASAQLRSECRHFELESAGHQLDAFDAFARADALVAHNFMVFRDLTAQTRYDLVIADEAWELDHYLHEHPEEKRAPLVWLTDFVGVLPMPDDSDQEARVIADTNALMVDRLATRPVRDLSLFVGNPEDLLEVPLGPGLPTIAAWGREHFTFTGYAGARRHDAPARSAVRDRLGLDAERPVCVVAVGGSGVGTALLARAEAAHELARREIDGLRTVLVTGPRIDARGPQVEGLDRKGYVPDLDTLLAAADYAIVQGGLATSMELAANNTPFTYVPLQRHFEQHFHVHHRLGNYGAGRRVDYRDAEPDHLAADIVSSIGARSDNRSVETDGHLVAATHISALLDGVTSTRT